MKHESLHVVCPPDGACVCASVTGILVATVSGACVHGEPASKIRKQAYISFHRKWTNEQGDT